MRFLKKYFRLTSRVCVFFILGYIFYFFHSHYSLFGTKGKHLRLSEAQLQSEVVDNELFARPKPIDPFLKFIDEVTSVTNSRDGENVMLKNLTFTEEDMLDEHGKPFQIVIWNHRSGIPGYAANPKECLGNISCQVLYPTADETSAHAVVFPAGHGGLPKNR